MLPSGRQAMPWPATGQMVAFCVVTSNRNAVTGFGLAWLVLGIVAQTSRLPSGAKAH